MKDTQTFEQAFTDLPENVREYNRIFLDMLIGLKVVDIRYGPDADGDPQIYYIEFDNGIKLGLASVFESGRVDELDRTRRYEDGSIIRFQFHDWPEE